MLRNTVKFTGNPLARTSNCASPWAQCLLSAYLVLHVLAPSRRISDCGTQLRVVIARVLASAVGPRSHLEERRYC